MGGSGSPDITASSVAGAGAAAARRCRITLADVHAEEARSVCARTYTSPNYYGACSLSVIFIHLCALLAGGRPPYHTVATLVLVWVAVLTTSLLKGGHGAPSIIGVECGRYVCICASACFCERLCVFV